MNDIKSDFKQLYAILSYAGYDVELTSDKEHFSIKIQSYYKDKAELRKLVFFFEDNGSLDTIEDQGSS